MKRVGLPPVHLAHERRVVAKTFIDIVQLMRRSVYGEDLVDSGIGTLMMVGAAVVIGHVERKPMSASKIALYIDLPRTTVLSKLKRLEERGVICRFGHAYILTAERAEYNQRDSIEALMRIITDAARQLRPELILND
jgi:hypothetical protein